MSISGYVINQEEVKKYMPIKELVDMVDQTFKWYGEEQIIMPSKITLNMSSLGMPSWCNSMPAYVAPLNMMGIKWIGGFAENKKEGMPYIMGEILINDPKTGELRAVLDGTWITDIRTGAQTAVAAKYLASKTDVLAIIGAGVQGISTTLCMLELFDLKEVKISDISKEACEKFVAEIAKTSSVKVTICGSAEKAVRGSDVIVTVTTANLPIVKEEWVKPGAFVSSMGSYQELDDELVFKADKLFVDHMGQNLHRGEFLRFFEDGRLKPEDIVCEFGDVACGKQKGRENNEERIVASLIGMGCLDIAIAGTIYNKILNDKDEQLTKIKLS